MGIQFSHINIIAKDWKNVADFYTKVFHCTPLPPGDELSGVWVDKLTGLHGAKICGVHLLFPNSPIALEIFSYKDMTEQHPTYPNTQGFTHIAFTVDNIEETIQQVLQHGGSLVGEIVEKSFPTSGSFALVYLRDPEGNIIELQQEL